MEAILKREIILDKKICRAIGVLGFVILTALGGFVRIPLPFSPVPLTLQTFFVLLAGAFLGSNLGALTQLSYIFLGVIGLPIFSAAGSGMLYLYGPTAGYLFGFILAAFFIGKSIKYTRGDFLSTLALFLVADLILLLCGILWLRLLFAYPLDKLFFIGFIPFLPGDLIKAFFACAIYLKLKSRAEKIF